ncbi:MAG: hypothetical protein ACOYM9_09575 [Bradymonadia bacterium]
MSDKIRFGEILVRAGVLERSLLENLARERDATGQDLGELLVARGIIDEPTMLQTIGKSLNRPVVNLESARPDPRALTLLPAALCLEHLVIPIEIETGKTGDHLHVAMANPLDVRAIKVVMQQARLRIQPLVASARDIKAAIARHYAGGSAGQTPAPARIPSVPSAPSAPSAPSLGGASPPAMPPMSAPPRPSQSPPAALPPPPPRPASTPANKDAVFDFAVMDLSAYDGPDAPAETPPVSRFGAGSATGGPPPVSPSPLFGQSAAPPSAPAPLFGAPSGGLIGPPPALGPPPLLGASPPPTTGLPPFPGLSSPASPGASSVDGDLARLLDQSADEALMATSDLVRPVIPTPASGRRDPDETEAGPGFGIVTQRRRPSSDPTAPADLRASRDAAPADPARSSVPLPPLPSLPGRVGGGLPAPPGPATTLPPLPVGPGGHTSSPRALPPLPPSLRHSRPGSEASSAAAHRDSAPSLSGAEHRRSGSLGAQVTPAPNPAAQTGAAAASTGGAFPAGVLDADPQLDLRQILERYTQALEASRQPADELISKFVERYGDGPGPRETDPLFAELTASIERLGPGVSGLLVVLIRHLARRGLVDLGELIRDLASNQNFPGRRP